MHILTFILVGAAPYVELPAGDYTICNKETRECLEVSGGHHVTVEQEADDPSETSGAPRGILLSAGVGSFEGLEGRASVAFGGDTWFIEPRVAVRRSEMDEFGWSVELTDVDLGFSLGLDSGSRPWFFALALDLGLVIPVGDDRNPNILHTTEMMMPSVMAPDDDPGVNAGVLARVGYALSEHLFVAVDAHVDVALLEHRATREKVSVGVRAGLGFSFD